jgi:hypothetical protein
MLKRLPSVIAIPLEEYVWEAHPVLRLHRLIDAVEGLPRFLTVVALGSLASACAWLVLSVLHETGWVHFEWPLLASYCFSIRIR